MKISKSLGVNLKLFQKIRTKLQKSNVNCEAHSEHSDKKRTSEFVTENQAKTDPRKSISTKVRNMGVTELLIKQVDNEDIHIFHAR